MANEQQFKLKNKIYIDLSGLSSYRALLDVIALLTMYATVLRPDVIVAKSGSLKQFATYCRAWSDQRTMESTLALDEAQG